MNKPTDFVSPRGLMTHQQIAAIMRISPARVQQIEQRALRKARKHLEKLGVKSADVKGIARPED